MSHGYKLQQLLGRYLVDAVDSLATSTLFVISYGQHLVQYPQTYELLQSVRKLRIRWVLESCIQDGHLPHLLEGV